MKEYEIGDVIPIYEVPLDQSYQVPGSNLRPQQVPVNLGFDVPGLIEAHFIVFNKGTEFEEPDSTLFDESDVKPIGQMRIKKLK